MKINDVMPDLPYTKQTPYGYCGATAQQDHAIMLVLARMVRGGGTPPANYNSPGTRR